MNWIKDQLEGISAFTFLVIVTVIMTVVSWIFGIIGWPWAKLKGLRRRIKKNATLKK